MGKQWLVQFAHPVTGVYLGSSRQNLRLLRFTVLTLVTQCSLPSHIAPVSVRLEDDVIVQGRLEMIVEGRLLKSTTSDTGMVSPLHTKLTVDNKTTQQTSFHVAHAVVDPEGHRVTVRILNALDKTIQLNRGSKFAVFIPLVASTSKHKSTCCRIVSPETCADFKEKVASTINLSLGKKNREKLQMS